MALKWSDIDWHRGAASVCRTIQHSKAGFLFDDTKRKRSRRVVKLQDFMQKALDSMRNFQLHAKEGGCQAEPDLIFRSRTDSPLKQRNVKREFRRLLEAAGIRPIRVYDLRHTAATMAVAAGVSVKVISDQLGHASISFTLERYSHVLPSIQDEAAARVDRMLMGSHVGITAEGTSSLRAPTTRQKTRPDHNEHEEPCRGAHVPHHQLSSATF